MGKPASTEVKNDKPYGVSGGCFEWLLGVLGAGVVKGAGSAKSAQFAWDWEVKFFLDLLLMTWIILP